MHTVPVHHAHQRHRHSRRPILLGECLRQKTIVHPLYVRTGLHWEPDELAHLQRYLAALDGMDARPLCIVEEPVRDLYGNHWSLTGENVPAGLDPLRTAPPHHRELAFETGLAALIEGLRAMLAGLDRGPGGGT